MTQTPSKPNPDDDGPSLRQLIILWAIAFAIVVIALWATVSVTAPTSRSL
jgi:hypothetical protein